MTRVWTVEEDVILKRIIEKDGIERACAELGRPKEAIDMRLRFLNDHSILVGDEGRMIHRYHMPHSIGDPPAYRSALGRMVMDRSNA